MNSPEADVYMVILNNQLAKGWTLDEVINNLSQLFKQTPDNIKNMLCQPTFVVESGVSQEKAKTTQMLVIGAGVGCQVKKSSGQIGLMYQRGQIKSIQTIVRVQW